MCGRYYVDEKLIETVKETLPSLRTQIEYVYRGDITPAMQAPVIVSGQKEPVLEQMTWGFRKFDGKGLIINARAETAMDKRLFRECVQNRRIVIPASAFYEWDREKNKVTFTLKDIPVIFLAGFYQRTEDAPDGRFVILTREANVSMEPVHDRMPLMIASKDIGTWLSDASATNDLLRCKMPMLTADREYEQQSLFQ